VAYRIPFDGPPAELPAKDVVGSKAHCLMRMARCGLPVPPAFVLSAQTCRDFMAHGAAALAGLDDLLVAELSHLGNVMGRGFGDIRRPLLLSVRSGAAVSMPGMMETVLNVGLNPATRRGLVRMTGNPRLAQDCRRRLVQQYGEVVRAIAPARFEAPARAILEERAAREIGDLDTAGLERLAEAFEQVYEAETGEPFPADLLVQIRGAVEAVLRSWSSERAASYRKLNGISDDLGTAVTIQGMVYGNLGPTSGSGVGFTRNPADGSNALYVDFLANAQGEDVVAGRHRAAGLDELERRAPTAHKALVQARSALEREFGDMQDFEFTVEDGRLFLLQARSGKRTPLAALRIARDMVADGTISPTEGWAALAHIDLDAIEETALQTGTGVAPIAVGVPAGVGVAVGMVAFDQERAVQLGRSNGSAILVRQTADTGDIAALAQAAGLVTAEGARTSHAAVVARQLGKPCIVACGGLVIAPSGREAMIGAARIAEGDSISIDAATGQVFSGRLDIVRRRPTDLIPEVRRWHTHAATGKQGRKLKRFAVRRPGR
jgi:pyruvate,orthophosphate dikinase